MPNGCGCCRGRNYSVCCYSSPKCCKSRCCPPSQYCCPSYCMPVQTCCYTVRNNRGCCGNNRRGGCCGH